MSDFILASQSPRRRELLEQAGYSFECIPACGEEVFDHSISIDSALEKVALAKAEEISASYPGRPVLAADTIVVDGSKILGKPASTWEAKKVLRALSGRWHEVKTAVVWLNRSESRREVFTTRVHFRELSAEDIEDYVSRKTCLDKAGSYGIQEVDFVDQLDGSYFNVVGLPVEQIESWLVQAADSER